ncbi:Mitochondrial nicotinamide adenine dinucleotide transporter 1 [Cytospora mali]|uniref:Mitochondrial nicotinamide adenine dinucleotide transporter 1 n=1 Tax=Cytospora mali TaxID=578113 RepID=A0A194W8U5_CYTMA|nr:Mitochondrial nicotinamide adenine dinucleotide transporter 1 [Valsa mali]
MYDSTLTPFERWAVRASDTQFNALAGAIGGFTSGIVTCPLDVIKTKLQAQGGFAAQKGQQHIYKGLVGTATVIWKNEGLRGMYRGLGPIILGYLPTWAVWFTVYNKSKTVISQYQSNTFAVNFWSSVVAGASSTIVTNPIWVIKTRLMSQSGHHGRTGFSLFPKGSNTPTSRPTMSMSSPWHYHSTIDAARKMYTTEGLRAFYSGLSPALLGLTHVAVQFPAYEYLKTRFTGQGMGASPTPSDPKAHWFGILCASILSKIMASSATYPHEVIRTRLQTQRRPMPGNGAALVMGEVGGIPGIKQPADQSPAAAENAAKQASEHQQKYRGILRTFRTILREEGWRAFYAGMGTNMMRAVPAATVTMLTYEFVMRELNGLRHQSREKKEALRADPSFV